MKMDIDTKRQSMLSRSFFSRSLNRSQRRQCIRDEMYNPYTMERIISGVMYDFRIGSVILAMSLSGRG
jgi:hypothetical protein